MSNKGIRIRVLTYFSLVFIPAVFFLASCRKDTALGTNILPATDLLNGSFTDTTTIITSAELKDSMLTNGSTYYLLGGYNDPVFGMTKASIYTQVIQPLYGTFAFTPTDSLDSVVLVLPFYNSGLNFYGTLNAQTFTVDTLEALPVANNPYYSPDNIAHGTGHIGTATILPSIMATKKKDTLTYGYLNNLDYLPNLWIKLNKSFGRYIINKCLTQGAANLNNYLKGLYISVSNPALLPGQGGIMYIDPYISLAGITFFCRDVGTTPIDTNVQWLTIGPSTAAFVHFDHDYSTTSFYASGKDSIVSLNEVYVQATSGVKTQISFPYLSNWRKKGTFIVNKAELDLPVDLPATGVDQVPYSLSLVRDSAGYQYNLVDADLGQPYFGGIYDAFNKQYVFNITRYMQSVLDGKMVDRGLYLLAGSSVITANGAVLYGPAKQPGVPRMRLKMYCAPLLH